MNNMIQLSLGLLLTMTQGHGHIYNNQDILDMVHDIQKYCVDTSLSFAISPSLPLRCDESDGELLKRLCEVAGLCTFSTEEYFTVYPFTLFAHPH